MVIEVDSNTLVRLKLPVKQYTICYLLHKQAHHQLLKYLEIDPVDLSLMETMVKDGWITGTNLNSITTIKVTRKFAKLFETADFFQELIDEFPVKVIRPDGTESYLRTAQKQSKLRYIRMIKNSRIKHDTVINALKAEIAIRTRNNTLKFMKTLPNWLVGEEYKNYEHLFEDGTILDVTPEPSYGTNLL
jgi:hypothetical protein